MRSYFILVILLAFSFQFLHAQQYDYDKSVQVEAAVNPATPSIILSWPADTDVNTFTIYRRSPGSTVWGSPLEVLDGMEVSYVDLDVEVGNVYEYRVTRSDASGIGNGYIYAGMEVPLTDFHGRLLLIIDETVVDDLSAEITLMESDFRADGWTVSTIEVDPEGSVTDVKAEIVAWHDLDPIYSKAVFLFGHVPVPYSGNISPDGHTDHVGAWPADVFYGDVDGNWTDQSVNNVTASQARNHNIPGDGKYDNSQIASDLELMIGRVDFHNMPAFADSEIELLRQYVVKSHAFKTKEFDPVRRALIENNFSGFAEGFGQNGLKNFTPMFGVDSVTYLDYSTLSTESYLWSYGCGGGSYTSASGIGNTTGFASDSLQTVFTMLFGSYFGDWDSQNNFLRAALATGTTLTNAWAARPNWEFHPMAIGYPIGACTKLSQNNAGFSYDPGFGNRMVHAALMGDPTLRLHMVAPPSSLTIIEENGHAMLEWVASADQIIGYNIYRKRSVETMYELVNATPVVGTSYVDSCLMANETYDYFVKAVKLESSASGTYFNQSLGVPGDIQILIDNSPTASFETNQTSSFEYVMVNNSTNANSYLWQFGDTETSNDFEPLFEAGQLGEIEIWLYAYGDCGVDSTSITIMVTSTEMVNMLEGITIHPNPVGSLLFIDCPECNGTEEFLIRSIDGRLMVQYSGDSALQNGIAVSELSTGMYILEIQSGIVIKGFRFFKE